MKLMQDTIAAISTALGKGAISIVRLSGPDAISIVDSIFSQDLKEAHSHTIHYGYIKEEDERLDEVLVMLMRAPKTFTKEDVVEINCHGGMQVTEQVLKLVLSKGARLAEPGEFTKRAFLNGRIDLVEAESVMDMIESKTKEARKLAMNQLSGKTSQKIEKLRKQLLEIISNIEVNIDYPEYEDIEEMTNAKILPKLDEILKNLSHLIDDAQSGRLIREGLKTVIVGRPNVGKSSLLNCLLEEDKAIVTEIEGTTRDVVEGDFVLDGILFHLLDTAGIHETENVIEKIGVEKSQSLMHEADLVFAVFNGNEKLKAEDRTLLTELDPTKTIFIINKNDLPLKIERTFFKNLEYVLINTNSEEGICPLKKMIRKKYRLSEILSQDPTYLSNARQQSLARRVYETLLEAKKEIEGGEAIDLVEIDLKNAWETLGEITGKIYQDELLDHLFQNFCVGK